MGTTKRDDIREAALTLFSKRGIEATTTREIAERAGTAEGTLYRHFDGKEDLAHWLFGRCTEQLRETLIAAAEEHSDPTRRLDALVQGVFDFFTSKPTACTYLLSVRNSDLLHRPGDRSSPPMQLFVETLKMGMSRGAFREESPVLLAGWILATIQRTLLFLEEDVLSMPSPDVFDRTRKTVLRIVGADPDLP